MSICGHCTAHLSMLVQTNLHHSFIVGGELRVLESTLQALMMLVLSVCKEELGMCRHNTCTHGVMTYLADLTVS